MGLHSATISRQFPHHVLLFGATLQLFVTLVVATEPIIHIRSYIFDNAGYLPDYASADVYIAIMSHWFTCGLWLLICLSIATS